MTTAVGHSPVESRDHPSFYSTGIDWIAVAAIAIAIVIADAYDDLVSASCIVSG